MLVRLLALFLTTATGAHSAMVIGTEDKFVVGTPGADVLLGTGRPGGSMIAGNGNDQIRGGIPIGVTGPDFRYINTYGGVLLPSADDLSDAPDKAIAGQPGAIGTLANDGNDWTDGGCGYRSKGGSGADTYQNHGFGCENLPFRTAHTAPIEGDRFVFNVGTADASHPMGFKIDEIDYSEITKAGRPYLRVHSFRIEMTGPLHQNQVIGFTDDQRGPASLHLVDVPRGDETVTRPDAIRAMIYAAATPGRQAADLAGAPAQWIFPIR